MPRCQEFFNGLRQSADEMEDELTRRTAFNRKYIEGYVSEQFPLPVNLVRIFKRMPALEVSEEGIRYGERFQP